MIVYRRYARKKLISLRIIFFILVITGLLSCVFQYEKAGYFISVIFASLSIVVIKDLVVSAESLLVSKYYFFGLIRKSWLFGREENIKMSSFGYDFGEESDAPYIADSGSGEGCLFEIFAFFSPPNITRKEVEIQKIDEFDTHSKKVKIFLNKAEFRYLQNFISVNAKE